MKPLRPAALAGAALVILGAGALAATAISHSHTETDRLPDGSVVKIWYAGNATPAVRYGAAPVADLTPIDQPFFLDPTFERLDRIAAIMDRQAATMLQAEPLQPLPAAARRGPSADKPGEAPVGVRTFSVVSTLTGSGVCTHSVEYESMGDGKPPKVIEHTSSGCPRQAAPAHASGAVRAQVPPGVVQASFDGTDPTAGRWR
jgi:hypothetical protein